MYFSHQIADIYTVGFFDYLRRVTGDKMLKGVNNMQVKVIESPKCLKGILRLIFGIKKES